MSKVQTVQLPVQGMDCNECVQHVQHALSSLPGVTSANVFLASEKANIQFDPNMVDVAAMRKAVKAAGYTIPDELSAEVALGADLGDFKRRIVGLLTVVFSAVLFIVVFGEWLGLFEKLTERVPWPIGVAIVLVGGYPVFRNVIQSTLKRQVTSHTLMTVGVLAALIVGEWATATVIVFLMRVGNYTERFTTERARRAVKNLTAMAPQTARVERNGQEAEVPISDVQVGDIVVVYPGDKIPVDGTVLSGQATINQAAITGEAMPVEVSVGTKIYAATIAQLGHLKIQTTAIGGETTFGRVVKMVEEAEMHRADVQRLADKFSAYYLPIVMGVAAITFLLSRNPLSTAAVLVVACSCSIALATPIAMLASIGAAAQRGLLIKGGRCLELLAKADVLLIDKTGTLTLGKPQITDVVALNGVPESEILKLAASAERYSEHPLAEAVLTAAQQRGIVLDDPSEFKTVPGMGIRAELGTHQIAVGNQRLVALDTLPPTATALQAQGKTLLYVAQDNEPIGILAASDTIRSEVPEAIATVQKIGIHHIELLTGDTEQSAAALAHQIGVKLRAHLLPEDKIRIVKEYQARGHTVIMVGDGVNDAPALAQADVGIAMGAAGTDIAIETAHIALMRDDWNLVPEVIQLARRTMGVVKTNLVFTTIYNIAGLTLAAFGILPPILAAAAQSLPDLGILGNSSRLLRYKPSKEIR